MTISHGTVEIPFLHKPSDVYERPLPFSSNIRRGPASPPSPHPTSVPFPAASDTPLVVAPPAMRLHGSSQNLTWPPASLGIQWSGPPSHDPPQPPSAHLAASSTLTRGSSPLFGNHCCSYVGIVEPSPAVRNRISSETESICQGPPGHNSCHTLGGHRCLYTQSDLSTLFPLCTSHAMSVRGLSLLTRRRAPRPSPSGCPSDTRRLASCK